MKLTIPRPLLLRGKVVQPDGSAVDRYVLVRDGIIQAVSRRRPPSTDDAMLVETGPNDWIFPGLIDLHTHTGYNVMPIWDYQKKYQKPFYGNRFNWRGDDDYKRDINQLFKEVKGLVPQNRNIIPAFAEIQAIAGGTTVLQEDGDLDRQIGGDGNPLICRGTGVPTDLELSRKILSVVDFFEPDAKTPLQVNLKIDFNDKTKTIIGEYALNRANLQATLVHLAEGRSGFGGDDPGVDPYTRLEFETLMAHPSMQDAGAVRSSALTLIHGCGIDVHNPAHIQFLRDRNISVIWSPVSNLLLYGNTLEMEALVNAGINVALGSDWSPSGSKHVWDEAKNAKFFFEAIGSIVSDVQVFQMLTTNAARCLGIDNVGRIAPGCLADFFILRSPLESDSAMEVFFKTEDRDVRTVIIGGRPIYGARDFFEPFGLPLQNLPRVEGTSVKNKVLHLPEHVGVQVEGGIDQLEAAFKKFGVLRSNLLVSSDTPYRERMTALRTYMLEFGERVRRWRRKRRTLGIPVRPDSVRVWRGYSLESPPRNKFHEKLRTTFIPGTPQFQAPLGLTAYLPAVLPTDVPDGVPDEIALVFYESQQDYNDAKDTIAGRAYADLHSTVFSFTPPRRSTSDWPSMFSGNLEREKPYFLFDKNVDWQSGHVNVLVASRAGSSSEEQFLNNVTKTLAEIQAAALPGLDGAIVVVASDFFVYWEHWTDLESSKKSLIQDLAKDNLVNMSCSFESIPVPASLHQDYPGLKEIVGGEALNVQFLRRLEKSR
jgi:hypothetical protein